MAIAFARIEFVKRSDGRNACQKSAYMGRDRISFHGNVTAGPAVYDWTLKGKPAHHEVLLPKGTDARYKNPETLWNAAEAVERRKNSQTAIDVVLALPDDSPISLEDRIELARSFVKAHFTDQGLGAQLDIHSPEKRLEQENGETVLADHNWHAHVLATTRRFTKDGLGLGEKARDLMPKVCKGKVISGTDWGKAWGEHQNRYFEEKGLALRVDSTGVIAQLHLGPVRMRGRAYSLFEEQELRCELNALESKDPAKILEKITETESTFSVADVDRFLGKFVPLEDMASVREAFWKQSSIIPLLEKNSGKQTGHFTSQAVWEEERCLMRVQSRLINRSFKHNPKGNSTWAQLSAEQAEALNGCLSAGGLACIDGHAGTGKSQVLLGLQKAYLDEGVVVRAFGADNATAQELEKRGFGNTENIYRFLFAAHHGYREPKKGREVWLLDEAGKVGSRPLLELLRLADKSHAKVILAGSQAQMASVARGNVFSELCRRSATHSLENIQRQKELAQREMARNLATGEVGHAIDKLSQLGGLRWTGSKQEAMEDLITQWTMDRVVFPKQSSLIIAHSNREMRVLNEMIHSFRRESGELGEKEYECHTTQGKCWISTSDLIEFRRNDKKLGVTNGMQGTLIEASKDRFVVGIRSSSGLRKVEFNPRDYCNFQLGYATTYYRSQGRTVDRAYVLHSQSMDRPMFYVGLTRHVRHAECFISSEDLPSIAALKRQLYREPARNTTLSFTSREELFALQQREERQEHVRGLLGSNSSLDRAKGMGLSLLDSMRGRSSTLAERFKDRRIDRRFYAVNGNEGVQSGVIFEVPGGDTKQKETSQALTPLSLERMQQITQSTQAMQQHHSTRTQSSSSPRKIAWQSLSDGQKELLKGYFDASDQASSLRTLVQESESGSRSEMEFRQACVERNEAAAAVREALTSKELSKVLSKKGCEIVQDRADRHQQRVEAQTNSTAQIQEQLGQHIEPLVYHLFPDGPSWKDQKTFRFGAKGSLAIRHSGPKAGSFYDFENESGGGLLQLIQQERGLNRQEALRWAKEFLGSGAELSVPSSFQVPTRTSSRDKEWQATQPSAAVNAPSLRDVSRKLDDRFQEKARYCYRDESGNPLFYTLRLEDRQNPSRKEVLPLSFGQWLNGDGRSRWAVKGFASDDRPLFNFDQVASNPGAKVLVVEGEKTAEAATALFKGEPIVCVTWCGGASAVAKTDWSPLSGREVMVWPDNDQAGFKAADKVCSVLRRAGAKSVKQVSSSRLQKFLPEKWDLADPLPKESSEEFVKDTLLRANSRSTSFEVFAVAYKGKEEQFPAPWLREILVSVEERLRPGLEETFPNRPNEIDNAILREASSIVSGREKLMEFVRQEVGGEGELLERMVRQATIRRAQSGTAPTRGELERIKGRIQDDGVAKQYSGEPMLASDLVLAQPSAGLVANKAKAIEKVEELLERQEARTVSLPGQAIGNDRGLEL